MTQDQALTILKTGANVFLTGAAGSGKTHVLREYIKFLQERGARIGITASTGIAATHMGGVTIHSWAGIGIKDQLTAADLRDMAEQPRFRKKFEQTSVLVIDEISMLDHKRLDLVDRVLRAIRGSDESFGGIQIVLCGDFFQLPPISRPDQDQSKFAYHSQAWKEANLQICYLHEQHRHSDQVYANLLTMIRADAVDEGIYEILKSRHNIKPKGSTEPTMLYSHNANVEVENERELTKISGKEYSYGMQVKGNKALAATLQKSCLAPETLRLKVGARVMFVKNLNEINCFNGTLGIVAHCDEHSITVKTHDGRIVSVEPEPWKIEEEGKVKAEIIQYPLRLAWAITVHKSQGMSLDAAIVDLRRSFAPGMGYVALSRIRALEGLCLLGLNNQALRVHPEVLHMNEQFQRESQACVAELERKGKAQVHREQEEFATKITPAAGDRRPGVPTVALTRELAATKLSPSEIAKTRELSLGTILEHLEQIKKHEPGFDLSYLKRFLSHGEYEKISKALLAGPKTEKGAYALSPAYEKLHGAYDYETIRHVRLLL